MGKNSRDYNRSIILVLANADKPLILQGKYYANPKHRMDYVTYIGVRPYVPQGVSAVELCDHINILYPDCLRYVAIRPEVNYTKDYLVCRARKYIEYDGTIRGGIYLTEELGIPPVIRASYVNSRKIIDSVPKSRYVDFLTFDDGKYAYFGKKRATEDSLNGLERMERLAEESRKQMIKGWNLAGVRADLSYQEFMKLYRSANPLWIPPPRNVCITDKKRLMKIFVPQRYLREILDRQPELKKMVLREFMKKLQ